MADFSKLSKPISFPFSDTEDSEIDSPSSPSRLNLDSENDEGNPASPDSCNPPAQIELERPILCDYLKKKGQQRGNWKSRWFVLRPTKLCYYKNSKEYEIINLISISKIHSVSPIPLEKRKFVFGIVTREKTYYLQAGNEKMMTCWVEGVRGAVIALSSEASGPRMSIAAEENPRMSHISISRKEEHVSAKDTTSVKSPDILIPEAIVTTAPPEIPSPHQPTIPLPMKQIQDISISGKALAMNPSPLSQSWVEQVEENDDVSDSDCGDEENDIVGELSQVKIYKKRVHGKGAASPSESGDISLAQGRVYRLKSSIGGVKMWKKGWYVIRNGKLTSYKNEQEYEVKRIILLSSVIAVLDVDPVHGKDYCFKLVLPKKSFIFSCHGDEDGSLRTSWIQILQEFIGQQKKNL